MNRNSRAIIASDTLQIVRQQWYETANSKRLDISEELSACFGNTSLWTPEQLDNVATNLKHTGGCKTVIEVRNETVLTTAKRIIVGQGNSNTLCLNFASAKNAGGGFLRGSQAQEESLARSSALYNSQLLQAEYYETNRNCGTSFYTDNMILSPQVPVFRDDDGTLLEIPYYLSILTAPAVNAGAVRKNESTKAPLINSIMKQRIEKVFALAAFHQYDHLILGAWGCGVFQNDPKEIAKLFADFLKENKRFHNHFLSVTFSVLDRTINQSIFSSFNEQFQ